MTEAYSIVPVRKFADTKVRLTNVLSREERASLTKALLRCAVSAQQQSDLREILIVSPKPEEVGLFLHDFVKIRVIRESHTHSGVNSAMSDGIQEIRRLPEESKVLLMPSDLPFLSTEVINRIIRLLDEYDLIINPSEKKDGTNLLAFHLSKMIPLHYNDNSFSKHKKEAEMGKLKFLTIDWRE
ncbi:MAG TPA: 2-phospho-L-lactate guanylyltransferase, partial [Nitrososphaerales archaeon]|nr:2-phospho-L-lactate guanylyltransferase [Nitrososphaerales archaeon]